MQPLPNGDTGLNAFQAENVTIQSNVLSGNLKRGVELSGNRTTAVDILNNFIGTNIQGTAAVPNDSDGVRLNGIENVVVQDNVISGNNAEGLWVNGSAVVTVTGNSIGTNLAGNAAIPNANDGVHIDAGSTDVTVGGTGPGDRNIISGNSGDGIELRNAMTTGNVVIGNSIGTDITGTIALGNDDGIEIEGAAGNQIGGSTVGEGNLISGNRSDGLDIFNGASEIVILGNQIGTTTGGAGALANGSDGILLTDVSNITIGGNGAESGNLVSGNGRHGIRVTGSHGRRSTQVEIRGNKVGTTASGNQAVPNGQNGIHLQSATNTVVGGSVATGNLVSGNSNNGIEVTGGSESIEVSGNLVGTNMSGLAALGNDRHGVVSRANNVSIGGATVDKRNIVSGNGASGVFVWNTYNNTVENNFLGTNVNGTAAIPNDEGGVVLQNTSDVRVVNNLASGNGFNGVFVNGSGFDPVAIEWPVSAGGNGSFYVLTPPRAWTRANEIATSLGGHLASITTVEENAFLQMEFGSESPWIGLSDHQNQGTFEWSSGEGVSFTSWSAGEPNGGLLENHAQIRPDGTWNDLPDFFDRPAIFEFASAPDPDQVRAAFGETGIVANNIGQNSAGDSAIPNGDIGLFVLNSNRVRVGGVLLSDGNAVAGNSGTGASITDSQQVWIGNNLISDNDGPGLFLFDASEVELSANYVGTTADGTSGFGNSNHGIEVRRSNAVTIGGTGATDGNLVSDNGGEGILVWDQSSDVSIFGNQIGTGIAGSALGNGGGGVRVSDSTNVWIGDAVGSGNIIANNSADGVRVTGDSAGVSIRGNSVYANDDLGIDLNNDGVTPNDADDSDTGPNGLQNSPVVDVINSTPSDTTVGGSLTSTPNMVFDIEIFSNNVGAAGNAQGETLIGTTSVTTDAFGHADYQVSLGNMLPGGLFVTATATDMNGNTSEFSPAVNALTDVTPPQSIVDSLSLRQSTKSFVVSVTADDPGSSTPGEPVSGVDTIDIFVAVNSGPFVLWQTVPASSPPAVFTGESNTTYTFRSVARDHAGNVEDKPLAAETVTYIPDLDAPETSVLNVDASSQNLVAEFQGLDVGGSGLAEFDVWVSVDSGAPQHVASVHAGTVDASGNWHGTATYSAIADGVVHTYRFFTVGTDQAGNVEPVPSASDDVEVAVSFAAPIDLEATELDVQRGAVQRSFIQFLDVQFNSEAGLQELLDTIGDGDPANDRIRLQRFETDGTGVGENIDLAGIVSRDGGRLTFDFGPQGIGGNRNSNAGNGYYALSLDTDGDGTADQTLNFYRLLGDTNGDRRVDTADLRNIALAIRRRDANPNNDINGDGRVNILDRMFASRERGKSLLGSLLLDD